MESQFQPQTDVEIDFGQLMRALRHRLPYLIVFVVLVAAGVWLVLGRVAPVYKSETTLLVQGADASLAGTTQSAADSTALDAQAITSQVQVIKSRDLAQAVADKLDLASKPEFDPKAAHPSLVSSLLQKVGLAKAPGTTNVDDHVLDVYFADLSVYAIENSRVIAIDFSSTNPQVSADVANAIADEYLSRQSAAKRDTSADAAQWLSDQIVDLRTKVQNAEAAVEDFRSKNNLFDTGGSTPTTLSQQQLNDLNTQLSQVTAARTAAEAKAAQIRAALQSNGVPSITDVLNSPLIQNLVEQEVALKSQIAQLSATLLPGHPRMRELNAQVAGLDQQIAAEAQKILDSVESDVSLDKAQEAQLRQQLDSAKQTTATQNDASVQLRALQREADADRQLLETYLARYREAVSREQGPNLPADARVISRAAVAAAPDFPKKVPLTAAATVAALILAIAFILLRELASGRPMRRITLSADGEAPPPPAAPLETPLVSAGASVQRTAAKEPTLVPEVVDRVEESLRTIAARVLESGQKRIL
ncbi:MAG TPA: GumC family protein, partial [Bauldia sp.]|nr:GumC family protein [Bauldia sp.]